VADSVSMDADNVSTYST